MARYGNRRGSKEDSGSSRGGRSSKSKSGGRSGGSRRGGGDPEFIGLGDLSLPKSLADDEAVLELADELKDSEVRFNLKVFVGRDEEITLKNGDLVMIKFKDYEKAKEWVEGKAFLVLND